MGAPVLESPQVKAKAPLRVTLWFRRFHMFLGLFLTPWLAMYAVSTVVFNHYGTINRLYGGNMEKFEPERQVPYARTFAAGTQLREKGEEILKDLNLSGSFGIQEREHRIVIDRRDPIATRRITYVPAEHRLVIEKRPYRTANLLTMLHSQVGYVNKMKRIKTWAFTVDLTAVATLLLVISGFWMWWELKVTRGWGLACTLFGIVLFGIFLRFA